LPNAGLYFQVKQVVQVVPGIAAALEALHPPKQLNCLRRDRRYAFLRRSSFDRHEFHLLLEYSGGGRLSGDGGGAASKSNSRTKRAKAIRLSRSMMTAGWALEPVSLAAVSPSQRKELSSLDHPVPSPAGGLQQAQVMGLQDVLADDFAPPRLHRGAKMLGRRREFTRRFHQVDLRSCELSTAAARHGDIMLLASTTRNGCVAPGNQAEMEFSGKNPGNRAKIPFILQLVSWHGQIAKIGIAGTDPGQQVAKGGRIGARESATPSSNFVSPLAMIL
jgi:hypothetical protein